jgi:NCS1 family nucleobase:cation symporter-1
MITCTVLGMLIWALCAAHGAGDLLHTESSQNGSVLRWNTLYGLQSIVGGYASGCLGQSDWTRYAKTPNAALFGQAVTAPIAICLTALCGLLITSATATLYGDYLWNPFELLIRIQTTSPNSPGARAGTFFAGLGFLASQLALCIVLNCVSTGMDLAALCPKYINIRRGSYLLTVIAVAVCPWNYVFQPTVFITVLSGWSVFLSPMTGILISDYFLVRKRQLHVGDLYLGVNPAGAYWYTAGFNWRAFVAWAMGLWPLLRKLPIHLLHSTTSNHTPSHDNLLNSFSPN